MKESSVEELEELEEVEKLEELEENTTGVNKGKNKDDYSLSAFFLTFIYYFMKGNWKVGFALLLSVAVLPKNYYFVVGLIAGFFVGKDREHEVSLKGALIACLGLLLLCILKVLRYKLVGSV